MELRDDDLWQRIVDDRLHVHTRMPGDKAWLGMELAEHDLVRKVDPERVGAQIHPVVAVHEVGLVQQFKRLSA
ncbi:MAG: hypothetical protein KDG57_02580, partial [Rhodoferax sp.]|nr:hypothetical protein [Rhodoferax sp.]